MSPQERSNFLLGDTRLSLNMMSSLSKTPPAPGTQCQLVIIQKSTWRAWLDAKDWIPSSPFPPTDAGAPSHSLSLLENDTHLQPSQGDSSHQERRRLLGLHTQSSWPPTTRDTHRAKSNSALGTLAIHRQPGSGGRRGLKSILCIPSLVCDYRDTQEMETGSR